MPSRYKYAKQVFPDENSPYTVDTLPMHKDTYFFGYGIDIDNPIEMANQIIYLKEQLERNEKARKEATELISIAYSISVDYDGFNDVVGLKSVIDDMARYLKRAKNILKKENENENI